MDWRRFIIENVVGNSKKNMMRRAKNIETMRRRHVGDQEADNNDEDKKDYTEILAGDDHFKRGSCLSIGFK